MSKQSDCINCQILGMQKAIDTMLKNHHKTMAEVTLNDLNRFIESHAEFNRYAKHSLKIDGGSVVLVPRKHGNPGATKERLITLFTFDGAPYLLKYQKLGHSGETHKADLPALKELIAEGLVSIVHQDRKEITYKYTPKATA